MTSLVIHPLPYLVVLRIPYRLPSLSSSSKHCDPIELNDNFLSQYEIQGNAGGLELSLYYIISSAAFYNLARIQFEAPGYCLPHLIYQGIHMQSYNNAFFEYKTHLLPAETNGNRKKGGKYKIFNCDADRIPRLSKIVNITKVV